MMTFAALALIAGLALTPAQTVPGRAPTPAPATATAPQAAPAATPQTTATPAVGATVYDPSGAVVGTIASLDGTVAVIDTGTNKVGFPLTSIGTGASGPTIAMTKAELDASAVEAQAKAAADLNAALVAGTAVRSRNGTASVGTIKAVDAEFVTLTTVKGDIRFPRAGFSMDPQGLIIGFTAEEFNKAIGAQ